MQKSPPTAHAIQTTYNGITFRSRTEARWAVFFDALNVKWEYEAEGYELPSGRYLPDFWIPHLDAFIEIKPSREEWSDSRFDELVVSTNKTLYVTQGPPLVIDDDFDNWESGMLACFPIEFKDLFPDEKHSEWERQHERCAASDQMYFWCQCQTCGAWGIEFDGRSARIACKCGAWDGKDYNASAANQAAMAASAYRFWNPGGRQS